jgi:hypothetical protein
MIDDNKEIWIFLSHSNEDYKQVRRIRNILEDMNTRPLMFFLKCLNDTDEIEDLIKREIKARTRFILCDSENAQKSNWVTKEIEYITELHKPYDIIDINASETEIRNKLNEFFRKEYLYISYSRKQKILADIVKERLSKYDFATVFDECKTPVGASFINVFGDNIKKALNCGHFIALLDGNESEWCIAELTYACKNAPSEQAVIPIFLDKNAKENYAQELRAFHSIDLSNAKTPNVGQPGAEDIPYRYGSLNDMRKLGDDVTNAILVRLQGWGNILTYGNQFRHGIGVKKDEQEADKLSELLIDHYERVENGPFVDGPETLIFLGNLFTTGECVRKDIAKARHYYESARQKYGIEIDYLLDNLK